MSLPLANTGVSGKEQEVCMPETPVVEALDGQAGSADGECHFVKGLRLDGPGRSVGRVLRSTGTLGDKKFIHFKLKEEFSHFNQF